MFFSRFTEAARQVAIIPDRDTLMAQSEKIGATNPFIVYFQTIFFVSLTGTAVEPAASGDVSTNEQEDAHRVPS